MIEGEALRREVVGEWAREVTVYRSRHWVIAAASLALLIGILACAIPEEESVAEATPPEAAATGNSPVPSTKGGPWGLPMRGYFTYMADAAIFEPCSGDDRFPVAMEADYISAERSYLEARAEAGAPLLMTVVGHLESRPPMEGDGLVDMLVIDRFVAVHSGKDCAD